jgi:hypothetical protein
MGVIPVTLLADPHWFEPRERQGSPAWLGDRDDQHLEVYAGQRKEIVCGDASFTATDAAGTRRLRTDSGGPHRPACCRPRYRVT